MAAPARPTPLHERYTVRELIEEASRELETRRRFYPRWVRAGRIGQAEATRRLELMEAIVGRLTRTARL